VHLLCLRRLLSRASSRWLQLLHWQSLHVSLLPQQTAPLQLQLQAQPQLLYLMVLQLLLQLLRLTVRLLWRVLLMLQPALWHLRQVLQLRVADLLGLRPATVCCPTPHNNESLFTT
jgi:hypothetical protein